VASPFTRLARTHALSTAGDAMVATALAGTIFFEGLQEQAKEKVFLYLLLTVAPFAVVSPLIGPVLDRIRSGRRWMIIGSALLRSAICFFMIGDVKSLLFYPEAFALLILQKSYSVARAALTPSTVKSDAELVEANSKPSLTRSPRVPKARSPSPA
jgi:MFS family permease